MLSQRKSADTTYHLPSAPDDIQASYLLSILFDPSCYHISGMSQRLQLSSYTFTNFIQIHDAQPFPFYLASPAKLIHSLVWIDTNIKLIVEDIAELYKIQSAFVFQIVETALKIFSYLIKQNDYQLARSINFNHSMFLQDRILQLVFGDDIFLATQSRQERGKLANHIALQLLRNLGDVSYRQLCTLSAFMGVIWTSREDIQRDFLTNPSTILSQIDSQLSADQTKWCIDHIDFFLADMGRETEHEIVVFLDDNGESVFDIYLFQRLLNDMGKLNVVFVVNQYPISNEWHFLRLPAQLPSAFSAWGEVSSAGDEAWVGV